MSPAATFPCGQCMHCRINSLRKRSARFQLEGLFQGGPSTFSTQTYEDDYLPLADDEDIVRDDKLDWNAKQWEVTSRTSNGPPPSTVSRSHATAFIKALRKRLGKGLRFALVAEYGAKTFRPHYHTLLFGIPPDKALPAMEDAWPYGFVQAGTAKPEGMNYCAGYILKKMTKLDAPGLEPGQTPEFSRSSLRPAIGAAAVTHLAQICRTKAYLESDEYRRHFYTPTTVRIGQKIYPLDRTMRDMVARELGWEKNPYHAPLHDKFNRVSGIDHETGEILYDYDLIVAQEAKLKRTIGKQLRARTL